MGGVLRKAVGRTGWGREPDPSLRPVAGTVSLPACAAPATMALADILLSPSAANPFSRLFQWLAPSHFAVGHLLRETFCARCYTHICPAHIPSVPTHLSSLMASYSKHLEPPAQGHSVTQKMVSLVSVKWTRCAKELPPREAALNQYGWSGGRWVILYLFYS